MTQEKWLVSGPKTIDLDGVTSVKVGLVAGQVDIVAHDEPGTRVEVHSVSGKDLRVTVEDGVLEIDHVQLGWENWLDVFRNFRGHDSADVSLMVPASVAVKLGVVSARGLVTGLRQGVTASSVSGELVIDGVAAELTANSVSGEISIRDHDGAVTARTVSGDLTAQGAIPRLSADGVSGAVFLDLTGVPDRIRVNTVSGDVTARLEPEVAAQYVINTVSGVLQLDGDEIRGVHGRFTRKVGELDQHWLDFSASTVSGDVSVMRSVRA